MLNSAATQNQLIGRYFQQSDTRFFKENNLNVETNEAEYSSDGRRLTKKRARFYQLLSEVKHKRKGLPFWYKNFRENLVWETFNHSSDTFSVSISS